MKRLKIQLDKLTREQLARWAAAQNISLTEAACRLLRKSLKKQEAAQRLLNIGLENLPEPETLENEIHPR